MTPQRLTVERLLVAWEDGIDAAPPARALAILASVGCDVAAPMPIGARDALLLGMRAESFDQTLPVRAECPACACLAEGAVDVADVVASAAEGLDPACHRRLTVENWAIDYRLPTAQDMVAASRAGDVPAARALLLRAVVRLAVHDGAAVDPAALDDTVVAALSDAIEAWDPLVENALAMNCARCGHEWHAVLEIGSYLHAEIADAATRIARDVDELARRYGWHERDILAMSAARRAIYLEQQATEAA